MSQFTLYGLIDPVSHHVTTGQDEMGERFIARFGASLVVDTRHGPAINLSPDLPHPTYLQPHLLGFLATHTWEPVSSVAPGERTRDGARATVTQSAYFSTVMNAEIVGADRDEVIALMREILAEEKPGPSTMAFVDHQVDFVEPGGKLVDELGLGHCASLSGAIRQAEKYLSPMRRTHDIWTFVVTDGDKSIPRNGEIPYFAFSKNGLVALGNLNPHANEALSCLRRIIGAERAREERVFGGETVKGVDSSSVLADLAFQTPPETMREYLAQAGLVLRGPDGEIVTHSNFADMQHMLSGKGSPHEVRNTVVDVLDKSGAVDASPGSLERMRVACFGIEEDKFECQRDPTPDNSDDKTLVASKVPDGVPSTPPVGEVQPKVDYSAINRIFCG